MTMTTRTRIATTVAAALALGVTHYGQAMNITDFGLERDLWTWGTLAALVLAVFAAVLSIGFLPRPAWGAARRRLSRRGRVPSPRG